MRKVLSFVLVLSLVLGSFSMAFAATPADVVGEASEEAVSVLSDLGVVSGYEDGTYKPENIVTRAEMAVLIIRALGLTDYVTTASKSSFKDMAGYGWAEGYVAYAQGLGFVSGYPDGTFKPGQTVSYDEAASMLVRALGWTPDSLVGTWPANFVVKAKALKILDGIQAGAKGANRGDVAIMLYQTLPLEIGTVTKDGEWKSNNKTNDAKLDDTMLSRLGATVKDAEIITDTHVGKANINIKKYLGAFAVTYEKSGKIIAVGEVESTFLTGTFRAGDEFRAGGVTYTNASMSAIFGGATPAAIHFNNGAEHTSSIVAAGDMATGVTKTLAVKLSGKKIETIYSVSDWTPHATLGEFQFDEDSLDSKSLNGLKFKLDDEKKIDLSSFELIGVDSLEDIKKDNVVYVYVDGTTSTSNITRVEVGTEVVKGQITEFVTADSEYVIEGKAYATAGAITTLNVGDKGTAYLDVNGDIFKFSVDSSVAGNYAVLVASKAAIAGYDKGEVKLFTKAGEEVSYSVKTDAVLTSASAFGAGTLVKYSVDKDGKLTDMVQLVGTTAPANGEFNKAGTIFDSSSASWAIGTSVVVFVKGTDSYSLGDIANIDKATNITLAAISYDGTGNKVKVLIVEKGDTGGIDSVYAGNYCTKYKTAVTF